MADEIREQVFVLIRFTLLTPTIETIHDKAAYASKVQEELAYGFASSSCIDSSQDDYTVGQHAKTGNKTWRSSLAIE